MNLPKPRAIFAVLMGTLFLLATPASARQEDSPPVAELRTMLDQQPPFREQLRNALDNLQDLPDGTPNPWRGKTEEDLLHFFNEWFYFLPTSENGLDRIVEFSMLYYQNPEGLKLILTEPGLGWTLKFVRARGAFMDSPASLSAVERWLSDAAINNDEYVVPEGGFSSFNDYFVRDLKPGRRPVAAPEDNSVLAAPADGIVQFINNDLALDSQIPTKGRATLDLKALLGGSDLAPQFVGGSALTTFLMPNDYHHYHAPVSGTVIEARETVGDRLFGAEDLIGMINNGNPGYNKDFSVFENFRHGYLVIDTEQHGLVAMIPIGLQTVGSVVFEDRFKHVEARSPQSIKKGEKVGHFAYGGSTVLLLFQKDRFSALSVKQGQKIATLH